MMWLNFQVFSNTHYVAFRLMQLVIWLNFNQKFL